MKRFICIVCVLLVALSAVIWPRSVSFAAPGGVDISVEKQKIQTLGSQMAAAQKSYEDALAQLDQARAEADRNRKEIEDLNARIVVDRQKLNTQADFLYRSGPTSFLEAMLSSQSFTEVSAKFTLLTQMSDRNAQTLRSLRLNLSRRMAAQTSLEKQLKTQEAQTVVLKSQTEQIKQSIASQQAYVNSLSTQQSAALEAAQRALRSQKSASPTPGPSGPSGGHYSGTGFTFSGQASWYDTGSTTANGEHFYPDGLTAACLLVDFNTYLRVTYQGRSVVVRVNDHGPYVAGRVIDLSRGAAEAIGMKSAGVGQVTCEIVLPH
ncbi:MAG: septal ring lytic transglycosylase RlpA family protein [Actinomycetia bacterium]|nr:septal ring lytic transglycosylase RlpA family protein [Actinomycetes bacterium]